jgi:hypothetical protein
MDEMRSPADLVALALRSRAEREAAKKAKSFLHKDRPLERDYIVGEEIGAS